MMFYDAQRKPSVASIEEQMANVSLNLSDVRDGRSSKFSKEISRSDCSQSWFLSRKCHTRLAKKGCLMKYVYEPVLISKIVI